MESEHRAAAAADVPKVTAVRTPVDVIMAMAKDEIENFTIQCMRANRVTPGLMAYVLKDVLLDLTQMQVSQLADEFTRQQQAVMGSGTEEKTDGKTEN